MIIFNVSEMFGSFILFLLSIIGRTVGLGGSSFAIGIFLFLFNFNLRNSIGYTQILICVGTLTTMILRFKSRNPKKDRPMIELDTLMQYITPILLGISLGTHIIPSFPIWLIEIIFVVVNLALFIYIFVKIIHYYNKFKTPINSSKNTTERVSLENPPCLNLDEEQNMNSKKIPEEVTQEYSYYLLEDKKIISKAQIFYYSLVFAVSVLLSNISLSPSVINVSACSRNYGVIIGVYAMFVVGVNIWTSYFLVRKRRVFELAGHSLDEHDIEWTYMTCIKVWLFSLVSGFFIGLLGMSTGYITNPFLLYFNITPDISTISSSFSIFYTSSIPMFQFVVAGDLDYRYALWISGVAVGGSLVGTLLLRPCIIKSKRLYWLLIILDFIVFITLGIIVAYHGVNMYNSQKDGRFIWSFSLVC